MPIIGTSPDAIDRAEDRERFRQLVEHLKLHQSPNQTVTTQEQGLKAAEIIGYPLMVRPSYVLGGRAMEVVFNANELNEYLTQAVIVSNDSPVLLDKFLDNAIEVDVDAICDGEQVFIGGIMEHIEQAGVHSGDSSCSLPPHHLNQAMQADIIDQMTRLASNWSLPKVPRALQEAGLTCTPVNKVQEGRPHIVDMIKSHQIDFIINTTEGKQAIRDSFTIRRSALQDKINYITTMAGATASLAALSTPHVSERVYALQELHQN